MPSVPVEWLVVLGIVVAGAPGTVWAMQDEGWFAAAEPDDEATGGPLPAGNPDAPLVPASGGAVLAGRINHGDPTRSVFAKDAIVWRESCQDFDLVAASFARATVHLDDGLTDGATEDLDVLFEDADGEVIASYLGESSGLGVHEDVVVPSEATSIWICLAGGADALFRVDLS